jgi:hypothetical protein
VPRFIASHRPKKGGTAYVRRDDADFFRELLSLYRVRITEYKSVKTGLYEAYRSDEKKLFSDFISSLERRENELLFFVSDYYGLAIRVREIDGAYYVKNSHMDVLNFFININHRDYGLRTRVIGELLSEVKACVEPDMFLLFKLLTARSFFVTHPLTRKLLARTMIQRLDSLFSNEKVQDIFETYPLDDIRRLVAESDSDLRCVQGSDWDLLEKIALLRSDATEYV